MSPLWEYFFYNVRKNWLTTLVVLLVPVLIPYILYAILFAIIPGLKDVGLTPVETELLPGLDRVAYADKDLVYFSYAPDTPKYKSYVQKLLDLNGITGARIRGFTSSAEAEHYFAIKNIVPSAAKHYKNSSFYSPLICEDIKAVGYHYNFDCEVSFTDDEFA